VVSEVGVVLRVQVSRGHFCKFPALFLADLDMHPANSFIHDDQVDQIENVLPFAKACPNLPIFDSFATYKTECNCRIISRIIMKPLAAMKPSCLERSVHDNAYSKLSLWKCNIFPAYCSTDRIVSSQYASALRSPIQYPLSNIDA